uniref:MLO-like protein n=1 Tax=Aegilops tauschii subsp. strangulata TaxID=200361 RepID=A0A453SGY7_AEGTS
PTWVVAAVCLVIVSVSLAAERFLHYLGKALKHKQQKTLYSALQRLKEGKIQEYCCVNLSIGIIACLINRTIQLRLLLITLS